MKKVLFWAALGLLTAVVSFSSCGKDDDDDAKNPTEKTDVEDEQEEQEQADDPSKIYPGFYYYQDDDYTNSYWFKDDSVIINSFSLKTGYRAPTNLRGKFRIDGDSLRLFFNNNKIKMAFGFKRVSKNELRLSGDINATLQRNTYHKEGKSVFKGPFKLLGNNSYHMSRLQYFFGCKDENGKIGLMEYPEKYYSYSFDGDVLRMKGKTNKELLARRIGENEFQIGTDSYEPFGHYLDFKTDCTFKHSSLSVVIDYHTGVEYYIPKQIIMTFYGKSPWQMHYKETFDGKVKYDLDCSYCIEDNIMFIDRVDIQNIGFNSDTTIIFINNSKCYKE